MDRVEPKHQTNHPNLISHQDPILYGLGTSVCQLQLQLGQRTRNDQQDMEKGR